MHRFFLPGLFLGVFLLPTVPLQAQLYELPFDEIVQRSSLIAEGRVLAQTCVWDNAGNHIYTLNSVEVTAAYKGATLAQPMLQVVTFGGRIGDRMELVSELVQYAVGDVGMFCLVPADRDLPGATPVWENYGSSHGFFRYNLAANAVEHPFHPVSGIAAFREIVRDATQELVEHVPGKNELVPLPEGRMPPVVVSFSPTSVTAGTGSTLTISGTGFGANQGNVRFINSNSGAAFSIDSSDVLSWSDTQIEVVVPSTSATGGCAGTGLVTVVDQGGTSGTSASNLTVEYAHSNITSSGGVKYGANLVEDNGNGGLTFTLSTTLCTGANQDAVNAFGRALRAWRCASGVNWIVSTSTSGINGPASDGVNIVTFDVGSPLPGGTLGVTWSYYGGCFSGGNLYWYVTEVDVNLKQSVNWYFCDNPATIPGSSYDFQTVVFHELGHGHQLSHVVDVAAVMHRSIANGQVKRTLTANEQAGADYIFGLPDHPCGPDPMDPVGNPACLGMSLPAACNAAGPCTLSLPVELTAFHATARPDGILLYWATATERNNDFFTLERSADAVSFEALAQIPGAGLSVEPVEYQFLDKNPLPGLNYYRLRQTDLDGSTALLGMVAARFGETAGDLRAYPNPVSGTTLQVTWHVEEATEEPLELILTDLPGRLIRQENVPNPNAMHTLQITELPPGIYLLCAYRPNSRTYSKPVLIVRQ